MKEIIKKVEIFHNTFNDENGKQPQLIDQKTAELRHRIMQEEVNEYLDACVKGDLVEIADALGDQLYILCGTILKHGMQHRIEEVFAEIHASNMSKLGIDGKPIYREDGKILKGSLYFRPNLKKIIK